MKDKNPSALFIQNCIQLISGEDREHYVHRYYEFINGGDRMYGSNAPISEEEWKGLAVTKQAELAEKMLNVPSLSIRYPGTFSGPLTKDMQMFIGLDQLESLSGDFMMVESYTKLLELPKLDQIRFDIFGHSAGHTNNHWSVLDALLFLHTEGFQGKLDGLLKYKEELDLAKPFSLQYVLETESGMDTSTESLKKIITKEFLYKNFAK
ncbi:hypothetical protein [Leptospira idonii]|uniref:Uncharacterized protein n=1 Tax=Leptospira idonii TaxID=1193500 RepID=A0A4R9M1D8_9LEPT|nr:hypothetical protein [Leptospira idonii]TGN20520.1 hypothetical protein EHS15_02695 [Leptospira idonii]